MLLRTKFLGDIPVNITPLNSLISQKVSVTCLKKINCKRISIIRNSRTIKTNTYIVTFNRLQLPSVIDVGYLRVRVEKYIPSSLRCTKCQKFGHHYSKCRNSTAICCGCGSSQSEMSYNYSTPGAVYIYVTTEHITSPKPTKCIKCEGPHPAFSKQCPKYKQEQEIITVKCTLNIPSPEAWKRILNKPILYA